MSEVLLSRSNHHHSFKRKRDEGNDEMGSYACIIHSDLHPLKRKQCVQYFVDQNLLPWEHALVLEEHIYIQSEKDPMIYRGLCARMAFNLKENLQAILENYPIDEIAFLTDEQLAFGTSAEKRTQKANEKLQLTQKYMLDKEGDLKRKLMIEKVGEHGASKCPKCHKDDELTYMQDQSRSIDEGMTQVCYCRRCHQKFRA